MEEFDPLRRRRGGGPRSVEELARQLLVERSALIAQLTEANEELAELRGVRAERNALIARLSEANEELAELRGVRAERSALITRLSNANEELIELQGSLAEAARDAAASAIDDPPEAAFAAEEHTRMVMVIAELRDTVLRALAASPDPGSAWHEGYLGFLKQIDAALRGEGIEIVGVVGEEFDPNIHEAIGVMSSADQPSHTIAHVERSGLLGPDGSVIRSAQVVVAKA